MNFLKKAGICFWTAIPLLYLASFKQIEVDALDRAYAVKECDTNYMHIREKDYQKRFDEGYDERDGSKIKSSKEKTFIKRIEILEYCIKHSLNDDMLLMDKLIQSDLRMLPDDAMPVKEKWRELAELRKKNMQQLDAELISVRESQFGLRIKHKTGQLNETSELMKMRKKIAQIKTVMNEIKTKGGE